MLMELEEFVKQIDVLTEAVKALMIIAVDDLLAIGIRSDDENEKVIGLSSIVTKIAELEEN